MRERDGQRRQEHRVQVAEEAVAVAADREEPAEVEPEDEEQHDPEPERPGSRARRAARRARRGRGRGPSCSPRAARAAPRSAPTASRRRRAARASTGSAVEHERPGTDAVEERRAEVAVREPLHEQPYCSGSERSRPHSWWSSATRSGVARLPSIVTAGSPGIRWIRKNDEDRHARARPAPLQQPAQRRRP